MILGYNDFFELPNGDLLIATNQRSVLHLKADLSHSEWWEPGIISPRCFTKGKDNQLLINTYHDSLFIGSITDSLKYSVDTVITGLPFISGIQWDAARSLYWVSTFSGLYRLQLKGEHWQVEKDGSSPLGIIRSLILADDGKLWMTVSQGISVFDPERESSRLYHKANGLQGLDFNLGAALKHSDGRLFFGGIHGMNFFNPDEVVSQIPEPQPHIVGISINQRSDNLQEYSKSRVANPMHIKELQLTHRQNNILLKIAGLDYSDPDHCIFKYQLIYGRDTLTVDHGPNPELPFPNLSSGKYTLKIWARNSDGVWSKDPTQLIIHISPPWYFTWWGIMLIAVLVAIVVSVLVRARYKEIIKNKNFEKAAIEAKRKAAETELAVLRLQTNIIRRKALP